MPSDPPLTHMPSVDEIDACCSPRKTDSLLVGGAIMRVSGLVTLAARIFQAATAPFISSGGLLVPTLGNEYLPTVGT